MKEFWLMYSHWECITWSRSPHEFYTWMFLRFIYSFHPSIFYFDFNFFVLSNIYKVFFHCMDFPIFIFNSTKCFPFIIFFFLIINFISYRLRAFDYEDEDGTCSPCAIDCRPIGPVIVDLSNSLCFGFSGWSFTLWNFMWCTLASGR